MAKIIANCFHVFTSIRVFLWLEILYSVKMQIPHRRNSILKLLSIIHCLMSGRYCLLSRQWCLMWLLREEGRWEDPGQWRTLESCSQPKQTAEMAAGSRGGSPTPPPSRLLEPCPEFFKNIKCKTHFLCRTFPSVSSLFLLASGRFMVWKIKVWIYFHYQRICKLSGPVWAPICICHPLSWFSVLCSYFKCFQELPF